MANGYSTEALPPLLGKRTTVTDTLAEVGLWSGHKEKLPPAQLPLQHGQYLPAAVNDSK